MSTINDGGPAFPRDHASDGHNGMTLRDYFAAKALAGLIAEPYSPGVKSSTQTVTGRSVTSSDAADLFAEAAYILADAMLKAGAQ